MPETPARKRPVSASRSAPAKQVSASRAVPAKPSASSVAAKRPAARTARPTRAAAPLIDHEAEATNYALRLTEGLTDDNDLPVSQHPTRGLRPAAAAPKSEATADDSFALRLSQALEAITAAQTDEPTAHAAAASVKTNWLASLDKLPPIRLPIGPAIPWKVGLPLFVAVVVLMGFMSRSAGRIDPPGVQLPAQQSYPVQQDSPLFAKPQPTDAPAPDAAASQPQAQAQPQLGVQDPGGLGFDAVDMGIKLVAVLALAYGSLMVLKKFGVGGASSGRGSSASAVRVISSLALAPNRSVHVVEVPGGKTLLIGATPNSVNLLADLSEPSPEK